MKGIIQNLIILKKAIQKPFFGAGRTEPLSHNEQQKVISQCEEPRSLIERSYCQYFCQKQRIRNIGYRVLMALGNGAALLPLIYFALMKRDGDMDVLPSEKKAAVFLSSASAVDRIPDSLLKQFDRIVPGVSYPLRVGGLERGVIFEIWKMKPLSFMFVLKCSMKIALYCGAIEKTGASSIIVTGEDSYTSSALTHYCHKKGIRHINVMHGEILYNLSRTFFQFDACYVWDEHYVSLLKDLRAEGSQFIVEVPSSLLYSRDSPPTHDITYYLQAQDKSQMQEIRDLLIRTGKSFLVRPHRVWTDEEALKAVFSDLEIEDPSLVDIGQSIMSSRFVISWFSTVLYQGYLNGRIAVVDDLSNPQFKQLYSNRYIMLDRKKSILMSHLLETAY